MSGASSESSQLIGGRYYLEEPIGRGGMGEVWRGRHVTLRSLVAIKFLHGASASNEATRKRFLTEAQVTANLKSRHAVQVFDYGVTEDGKPYLVMELLEGETLDKRLARVGKLGSRATVRLLRQAARALDRAHGLNIVHRDFKPENIVIVADEEGVDEVKVFDFGVAKLLGELEPSPAQLDDIDAKSPMTTFTRTGSIVGTPYYMAPEQIRAPETVGPAADLWALGVVTYECLTGRRPFEGDTVTAVLRSILERRFDPPSAVCPTLPKLIDEWFDAACATEVDARFPDAVTAIVALGVALEEIPNATPSERESYLGSVESAGVRPSALAQTLEAGAPPDLDSPSASGDRLGLGGPSPDRAVSAKRPVDDTGAGAERSVVAAERGAGREPTPSSRSGERDIPRASARRWPMMAAAAGIGAVALVALLAARGTGGSPSAGVGVATTAPTATGATEPHSPPAIEGRPADPVSTAAPPPPAQPSAAATAPERATAAPPATNAAATTGATTGASAGDKPKPSKTASASAAPAPAPPTTSTPTATAPQPATTASPSPFKLPELGL